MRQAIGSVSCRDGAALACSWLLANAACSSPGCRTVSGEVNASVEERAPGGIDLTPKHHLTAHMCDRFHVVQSPSINWFP